MEDDISGSFYTQTGYEKRRSGELSPASEDYLEMIYRLSENGREPVRVKELSDRLHVSPSSASRTASLMGGYGYVNFQRYGFITLTESGMKMGEYLISRYKTVNSFLCALKGSSDETVETEKIEHFLSAETVEKMKEFYDRETNKD